MSTTKQNATEIRLQDSCVSGNGLGNLPTIRVLVRLHVLQGDCFNSLTPGAPGVTGNQESKESAFLEINNLQLILHMHDHFKGLKTLLINYVHPCADICIVLLLNNLANDLK